MSVSRQLLPVLLSEKKNAVKGGIYNKMQVDFAYNSNRIEGNCLTYEQILYIFETHTIGGTASVNDVFEAANHFRCFDYILDTIDEPISESLSKSFIASLNQELLQMMILLW